MAGILFRGEIRNETVSESYATITIDGWTMSPRWASMEEILNEQYEPKSFFKSPADGFFTVNLAIDAVFLPDAYDIEIVRKDYEPQSDMDIDSQFDPDVVY
jgi:hypothetical protein